MQNKTEEYLKKENYVGSIPLFDNLKINGSFPTELFSNIPKYEHKVPALKKILFWNDVSKILVYFIIIILNLQSYIKNIDIILLSSFCSLKSLFSIK